MPEVRESVAAVGTANAASKGSAVDILRAAYPAERERERAIDCLTWVAWHMWARRAWRGGTRSSQYCAEHLAEQPRPVPVNVA